MSDNVAILNSFTAACSLVAAIATLLLTVHKAPKFLDAYEHFATGWHR